MCASAMPMREASCAEKDAPLRAARKEMMLMLSAHAYE